MGGCPRPPGSQNPHVTMFITEISVTVNRLGILASVGAAKMVMSRDCGCNST